MYKFLEEQSSLRLKNWYQFRQQLESSSTPLDDVVKYFSKVPRVKVYTDPYDQSTWPTAWELIDENEYCQFNIILAICYTLQLITQYQNSKLSIKISIDNVDKAVYYLLFVDDNVYGLLEDEWIPAVNLPTTLKYLKIYNIPPRH